MLLINRLIPFAILMSPADDLSGADAGGGENPPAAKTPIVKVDTTPAGFSQADLDAAVAKAVAANNTLAVTNTRKASKRRKILCSNKIRSIKKRFVTTNSSNV